MQQSNFEACPRLSLAGRPSKRFFFVSRITYPQSRKPFDLSAEICLGEREERATHLRHIRDAENRSGSRRVISACHVSSNTTCYKHEINASRLGDSPGLLLILRMCVYMYINVYIHTHVHVYVYMCRGNIARVLN